MIDTTHILLDFTYSGELPNLEKLMDDAILKIGEIHIVYKFKHNFNPYGLSLVYILAESHISIHTWEEYNYISVDMYTCGEVNPNNTLNEFLKGFHIKDSKKQIINRGLLNLI